MDSRYASWLWNALKKLKRQSMEQLGQTGEENLAKKRRLAAAKAKAKAGNAEEEKE